MSVNNDVALPVCKSAERGVFDWNDLKYFLAVARAGSTLAAGRALGVSQTTAARRVAALEQALGRSLFERRAAGYMLTVEGDALLAQAEAVEAATAALVDLAASRSRDASGAVRLTTDHIFAVTILAPIMRDLHEAHPAIRIELDASSELRDLAAGAADIALRRCARPEGAGLVGRRLAEDSWALYCSRGYADAHGRPRSRRELPGHALIGGGGDGVWKVYRAWLEENGLEDAVAIHHDSPIGLLSAVRAGSGLAVLPRIVADNDSELLRCLPPAPDKDHGLWLLTHERLRQVPRVRVVLDFLAARFAELVRASRDG